MSVIDALEEFESRKENLEEPQPEVTVMVTAMVDGKPVILSTKTVFGFYESKQELANSITQILERGLQQKD